MVLKKLEQEIAALQVSSERGLTRPGAFLFDLFAKYESNTLSISIISRTTTNTDFLP